MLGKQSLHRGFQLIEFEDHNGQKCSLQQSSGTDCTEEGLANPGSSFVWLGKGDERMHLNCDQVEELIELLTSWVESGKFTEDE